jgi:hypothetical protein
MARRAIHRFEQRALAISVAGAFFRLAGSRPNSTGRLIEGAGSAKQRIDSVIEYLRGLQVATN